MPWFGSTRKFAWKLALARGAKILLTGGIPVMSCKHAELPFFVKSQPGKVGMGRLEVHVRHTGFAQPH